MDIRYHHRYGDTVADEVVIIIYVSTADQRAAILTKTVPGIVLFKTHDDELDLLLIAKQNCCQ